MDVDSRDTLAMCAADPVKTDVVAALISDKPTNQNWESVLTCGEFRAIYDTLPSHVQSATQGWRIQRDEREAYRRQCKKDARNCYYESLSK